MCRLLLMFVPKTFNSMRIAAFVAVLALVAVATAFDFDQERTTDAAPADQVVRRSELIETGAVPLARIAADDGPALDDIELIAIGEFVAPVEVLARPGDDRIFVVELMGNVMVVTDSDGDNGPESVLDVSEIIGLDGEQGLLGAAFHPSEDFLYVHYSNLDGDSIIAEFAVDPDTAEADVDTERQVLFVDQPYNNHNGGEIAFGPDGYLYIGFGDGGLADDPDRSALDLSSRLGKILRIDPLETDEAPFTVPEDNPFVTAIENGADQIDPTVWSFGLRNPWRFSFDPLNGDLWIADVGQNAWEEVNRGQADRFGNNAGRGLSYGWSAYEGDDRFNDDQFENGHQDPFLTYARDEGLCSISGGAVYRGQAIPELAGHYVYADYCTGQIFAFDTNADADERDVIQIGETPAPVAVAAGADGELYVVSVAGPVSRLS